MSANTFRGADDSARLRRPLLILFPATLIRHSRFFRRLWQEGGTKIRPPGRACGGQSEPRPRRPCNVQGVDPRADQGRMESPSAIHRPCESALPFRLEENTSELQSLMRISYAVF